MVPNLDAELSKMPNVGLDNGTKPAISPTVNSLRCPPYPSNLATGRHVGEPEAGAVPYVLSRVFLWLTQ